MSGGRILFAEFSHRLQCMAESVSPEMPRLAVTLRAIAAASDDVMPIVDLMLCGDRARDDAAIRRAEDMVLAASALAPPVVLQPIIVDAGSPEWKKIFGSHATPKANRSSAPRRGRAR